MIEMTRLRLFLLSFLILFTELALIRFIPSCVRLMGFFANITLLAAFLGLGLGLLWTKSRIRAIYIFPLFLLLLITLTVSFNLDVQNTSPNVIFFTDISPQTVPHVEPTTILPFIFLLVSLCFAMISQEFGRVFGKLPPITAYTIDIAGSLLAIIIFSGLSFLGVSAWIWFIIIGAVGTTVTFRPSWKWIVLGILPLVCTIILVFGTTGDSLWSPYYRVDIHEFFMNFGVSVNTVPNQYAAHWLDKEPFYRLAYEELHHPEYKNILILGSGTGNDVATALGEDPSLARIDAVEIDPVVAQLGVAHHPDQPYEDPRVHLTVGDGRNFLANSKRQYDLIIFALTDSLVLTSQTSNIRLESFLFTEEAMKEASQHLTPNGLAVFYNYYREPWLVDKIAQMAMHSFGTTPYVYLFDKQTQAAIIMAGPKLADLKKDSPIVRYEKTRDATPATDDWPFLYVQNRGIPAFYLTILGTLLALAVILMALSMYIQKERGFNVKFFLFGAAFLLLETKSLTTFSLLFGATWFVNSLVFGAILTSILIANIISMNVRIKPGILYILLFGSLLLSAMIPTENFLSVPGAARYVLAAVLYFSPVFFANMIFSQLFKNTPRPVLALSSNILGAVLGGFLEYSAMAIGYHALFFIIAACYLITYAIH